MKYALILTAAGLLSISHFGMAGPVQQLPGVVGGQLGTVTLSSELNFLAIRDATPTGASATPSVDSMTTALVPAATTYSDSGSATDASASYNTIQSELSTTTPAPTADSMSTAPPMSTPDTASVGCFLNTVNGTPGICASATDSPTHTKSPKTPGMTESGNSPEPTGDCHGHNDYGRDGHPHDHNDYGRDEYPHDHHCWHHHKSSDGTWSAAASTSDCGNHHHKPSDGTWAATASMSDCGNHHSKTTAAQTTASDEPADTATTPAPENTSGTTGQGQASNAPFVVVTSECNDSVQSGTTPCQGVGTVYMNKMTLTTMATSVSAAGN